MLALLSLLRLTKGTLAHVVSLLSLLRLTKGTLVHVVSLLLTTLNLFKDYPRSAGLLLEEAGTGHCATNASPLLIVQILEVKKGNHRLFLRSCMDPIAM